MKVRIPNTSVNLSTGERSDAVIGEGELRRAVSDPRLLSAEKLEREFIALESDSISMRAGARIRQHIAALTEQLATLRTEAAKLGHEPGCASNICANCGQRFDLRHYQPPGMSAILCVYGGGKLQVKPCGCAQSRIQGSKT